MGYVGSEEHLDCVQLVNPQPQWKQLGNGACLGYKFTIEWAGVPYWSSDDGYVITNQQGKQYIPLSPQDIALYQAAHQLPTPLPAYSVPVGWRLAGLSLWLLLAAIIVVKAWRMLHRRRLARERADTPITRAGRVLVRSGDRKLDQALARTLEPGEVISHQAVATDRDPHGSRLGSMGVHTFWVGWTGRRLLVLGHSVRSFRGIRRTEITRIVTDHETLVVHCAGGNVQLVVPFRKLGFSKENQLAFLRDVPRIANGPAEPTEPLVPAEKPAAAAS
jgi:hypothetical protein